MNAARSDRIMVFNRQVQLIYILWYCKKVKKNGYNTVCVLQKSDISTLMNSIMKSNRGLIFILVQIQIRIQI